MSSEKDFKPEPVSPVVLLTFNRPSLKSITVCLFAWNSLYKAVSTTIAIPIGETKNLRIDAPALTKEAPSSFSAPGFPARSSIDVPNDARLPLIWPIIGIMLSRAPA